MSISAKLYCICLFITTFQACAQVKNTVVKSNAFFMIPMPGTVPVDEQGNEVRPQRDTVYFIYVETKEKDIKWERAWKNGRSFSVIPSALREAKTVITSGLGGNQKIRISPADGNTVWQIELSDDQQKAAAPQPLKAGEILLIGKEKGKAFYVTINTVTEIASPEYQ